MAQLSGKHWEWMSREVLVTHVKLVSGHLAFFLPWNQGSGPRVQVHTPPLDSSVLAHSDNGPPAHLSLRLDLVIYTLAASVNWSFAFDLTLRPSSFPAVLKLPDTDCYYLQNASQASLPFRLLVQATSLSPGALSHLDGSICALLLAPVSMGQTLIVKGKQQINYPA